MKYVGFDWASQAHDVTVLDEAGQVLDRWAFPLRGRLVDDGGSAAAAGAAR